MRKTIVIALTLLMLAPATALADVTRVADVTQSAAVTHAADVTRAVAAHLAADMTVCGLGIDCWATRSAQNRALLNTGS